MEFISLYTATAFKLIVLYFNPAILYNFSRKYTMFLYVFALEYRIVLWEVNI